jgi:hypothetical protein
LNGAFVPCPDPESGPSNLDLPSASPNALALASLELIGHLTAEVQFVTFDSRGSGRCWYARPVGHDGLSNEPALCAAAVGCGGVCVKPFFGLSEDPDAHVLAGTIPAAAKTVTLVEADGGSRSYRAAGPLLAEAVDRRIFMVQLPDDEFPRVEVA